MGEGGSFSAGHDQSEGESWTMLKESLLAAALAMPAWHGDKESDGDRHARLEVIAHAIDEAVGIATCRTAAAKPQEKRAESKPVENEAIKKERSEASPAKAPDAEPKAAPPIAAALDTKLDTKLEAAQSVDDVSKSAQPLGESAKVDGAVDAAPAPSASAKTKPCKRIWAGTQRELGFLLLAQAFFETRLALHVHEGNCRKEIGECDSGRAVSLWQLHAGYHLPVERWRELSGTDLESTRDAALEAARALGRSRNLCGTTEGAVANYATGRGCVWKPAEERVRMAQELTNKFWRRKPPPPPVEVKPSSSDAVSLAVPKQLGVAVAAVIVTNRPTPGS
jgi:hypothetical protein